MCLQWNTGEDIFLFLPPVWQLTLKVRLLLWLHYTSSGLTWDPGGCVKGTKGKEQRGLSLDCSGSAAQGYRCAWLPLMGQWPASFPKLHKLHCLPTSEEDCIHHPTASQPGEWQAVPHARRSRTLQRNAQLQIARGSTAWAWAILLCQEVRKFPKAMGICQKATRAHLRQLLAKTEDIWASKQMMILMDYNLLNKIKFHEPILI